MAVVPHGSDLGSTESIQGYRIAYGVLCLSGNDTISDTIPLDRLCAPQVAPWWPYRHSSSSSSSKTLSSSSSSASSTGSSRERLYPPPGRPALHGGEKATFRGALYPPHPSGRVRNVLEGYWQGPRLLSLYLCKVSSTSWQTFSSTRGHGDDPRTKVLGAKISA